MENGNYFKLIVSGVTSAQEDLIVDLCFEHGASGVSENLAFSQTPDAYEPVTQKTPVHKLEAYFSQPPSKTLFARIKELSPQAEWELIEEQQKDWLAEWKKGFVSFELVDGIWVVPSWLKPPEIAQDVIHVDPGMAFGTGTHATTQLVSRLIKQALMHNPNSLLDVGTGTGILAILAKKLGIETVVATEIDLEAHAVAHENFAKNQISVMLDKRQVEDLDSTFDVVVANIIDGVLLKIQQPLCARVKPGGFLVLSGILLEREKHFWQHFDQSDFELKARSEQDEWVGLLLGRKS